MIRLSGRGLLRSLGLRIRELFVAAAVVALVATLAAFGGRWWWLLELLTHFRVHCLAGLFVGIVICAFTKRHFLAALLGVAAAYNLALIVPFYWSTTSTAAGVNNNRTLRLLLANVNLNNQNHQALLNLIDETSPDIVLTLEVTPAWLTALDSLSQTYPHQVSQPRTGSFGIALWSRLPTDQLEVKTIGPADVPSIIAHFDRGSEGSFTLIGTHPPPPMGATNSARRNEQLRGLGEFAASQSGAIVLAGDLNITSWSPFFSDLLTSSELRDTRIGFGIQPTWLSPVIWLGIPIDHVLASPEIAIQHRAVGPSIGSDHRPVIIDFTVPPSATPLNRNDEN